MKKTQALRLLAVLAALLALLFCLVACRGEGDTTTEPAVTEQADPELLLFSGGETDFVIIRPEKTEDTKIYTDFRNSLRKISGSDINIDVDAFYRGHEYDEAKPEILCGPVAYPESEGANDGLGFDDYKVFVKGKKIIVAARSSKTLEKALDAFCDYIKNNIQEGSLSVGSDFLLTGSGGHKGFELLLERIPEPDGYSTVALSHCGDGYQQATLSGASAESFSDYRTTLESGGFTLYAENTLAENTFVTYSKGELNVHTYYTPHNSEMRIVVSEDSVLPWKETPSYTKVCEPTVTLMGLEKSGSEGGLGMIIGLEDGTFIIIDGGNNNETEARDLAETLRGLAPDKNNIVIRAWFFTHAHGDHVGAFRKFSAMYARSGKFKIEKFIYNFCDAASQRVWGGCGYSGVLNDINGYWKDSEHYKALTGEIYRFPGCDIEILYCMSDFIPQIIGEEKGIPDIDKEATDNNIETVVFRARVGGQTLMVTGDTSKVCVDEICDRYGSYLKSDILQVTHHGHNRNSYRARNGTKEFYKLCDPSTVLWPCGAEVYPKYLLWNGQPGGNYEANYTLVNKLNVKEVIVAGSTTRTITLPYNP